LPMAAGGMRSGRVVFVGLALCLVAVAVGLPFVGSQRIGWPDVVSYWRGGGGVAGEIFWRLRVPRVLMAMVTGAALAGAGTAFQAMFRNPLASPFTLGVSSGAGLGAALSMRLAEEGAAWGSEVTLMAFAGALCSVTVVYGVARLRRGFSSDTLLLAGISIGFICSATILLVEYFSSQAVTDQTVRWLMGSVEVVDYSALVRCVPLVAAGLAVLVWLAKELDLLMMGDLVAAGRGVDVRRVRRWVYFAASLVTAAVVAHTGPIAFVGLLVPHAMRFFVGPVHGRLLPAAIMAGACFLPICDAVAANAMRWASGSAMMIPVGVLTSLLGGVFFLAVLLTRRAEGPIL